MEEEKEKVIWSEFEPWERWLLCLCCTGECCFVGSLRYENLACYLCQSWSVVLVLAHQLESLSFPHHPAHYWLFEE